MIPVSGLGTGLSVIRNKYASIHPMAEKTMVRPDPVGELSTKGQEESKELHGARSELGFRDTQETAMAPKQGWT
jgi:hypothetical protein